MLAIGLLTVTLFVYVLLMPLLRGTDTDVRLFWFSSSHAQLLTFIAVPRPFFALHLSLTRDESPQFKRWRESGVLSHVIPVRTLFPFLLPPSSLPFYPLHFSCLS